MLQEDKKAINVVSQSIIMDDVIIENRHSYTIVGKISEIVPVLRKCDMMKSMGLDRAKRQAWKMIKKLPSTQAKNLAPKPAEDALISVVDWYNDVQKYGSMSTSFLKAVYQHRYAAVKHRIRARKEQRVTAMQNYLCDAEDFNGLWIEDYAHRSYRDEGMVEVRLQLPRNHRLPSYLRQVKDFYNREFKTDAMQWHSKYEAYQADENSVEMDSEVRMLDKLGLSEGGKETDAWIAEYLQQLGCEQ